MDAYEVKSRRVRIRADGTLPGSTRAINVFTPNSSGITMMASSTTAHRQSILVLGASVVVPVLGSTAAVVLAVGRYRALRKSQDLGKQAASLTAN